MVSTAGVLLGKSIQMSDDVYQAMTSRGFRGEIHVMDEFRMTSRDWGFVFAIAALACGTWWIGR
jgi:energy-coupling factor transporter transmembrane protein EcfT